MFTDRPIYMSMTAHFRDSRPDLFGLGSFNTDRCCSEYEWEYFIIWFYWLFIGRDTDTQLDPRCFFDYDWYLDYSSEIAKFRLEKDRLKGLFFVRRPACPSHPA